MSKKIGDGKNIVSEVVVADLAAPSEILSGEPLQASPQAFPEGAKPEARTLARKKRRGVDDDLREGEETVSDQAGEPEQAASGGASESPLVMAQASTTTAAPAAAAGTTAGAEGAAAGSEAMAGAAAGGPSMGVMAAGAAIAAAAAAAVGGGGAVAASVATPALFALTGRVADGYVSGAQIFIDVDRDGVADANEDTGVVTDAQGNFSLSTTLQGSIIAVGGTNIDTGLANTMVLRAPAGSTMVNPLTTVLEQYIQSHPTATAAAAQTAVNAALGIPTGTNLTTYDPLAAAPGDPVALAVQKVAAQIVAATVLSGGNDVAVLAKIAALVDAGGDIDLTSSTVLSGLYTGLSGVNLAEVLASTNAIEAVTTLAASGPGSLTETQLASLNGTNDAPVFISGQTASVNENSATGTVVYLASANDLEAGTVTYSLTDNAGGKFAINATTGQVTVAGAIDFEAASSLQITVAATDGSLTSSQVVTISVNDVPVEFHTAASFAVAFDGSDIATVTVNLASDVASWEYSTDGGVTFTPGTGSSFQIPADTDLTTVADSLQVREIYTDGAVSDIGTAVSSLTVSTDRTQFLAEITSASDIAAITVAAGAPILSYANNIGDGGDDQYDNGNYISPLFSEVSTDLDAEGISYAVGEILADEFGAGSHNVVVYDDSIFAMLVTGNASDTFQVRGELGADGDGFEDVVTLGAAYNGYVAIAQRTWGSGDPSINRVFIHQVGGGGTAFAPLDGDTNTDDLSITGLTGVDSFAYAVVYGAADDTFLDDATLEAFFHAFVDSVLTSDGLPVSIEEMQAQFYANQAAIRAPLPALFPDFDDLDYELMESSAFAHVDSSGTVGNVSVTASGISADAEAYITSSEEGAVVTMQDSVIEVVSSGLESEADMNLFHAAGSITSLTLDAQGYLSDARVGVSSESSDTGTLELAIGSINVLASGTSAEASLYGFGLGSIMSVVATAEGEGSFAYAGITANDGILSVGSSILSVGSITQTALGDNSNAMLSISSDVSADTPPIFLTDSVIEVTASGAGSLASSELEDVTGSISSITLTASGFDSTVSSKLDYSGFLFDDYYGTFGDNITLRASGDLSYVELQISSSYGLRPAFENSVISLTSSGEGSRVSMDVRDAAIEFGTSSDFFPSTEGSISSITLTASSADSSASMGLSFFGTMGDITMLSTGERSDLELEGSAGLGSYYGSIEFNTSVISVTASSTGSDFSADGANASLDLMGVAGSIASVTVTAEGTGDSSYVELEASRSLDVGSITVDAQGDFSYASVRLAEGFRILVDGGSEDAPSAHMADSVITVTAFGTDSYASLELEDATGSIDSLTVTASGVGSIGGSDIAISGDITQVNISSISANALVDVALRADSVLRVDVDIDGLSAGVDLALDLGAHGGVVAVLDTGDGTDFHQLDLTYEGFHMSDTLDLSGFNGDTNIALHGRFTDDLDLSGILHGAMLKEEMLSIVDLDADVSLYFTDALTYAENIATDAGSVDNFLAIADSMLDTNDAYFGFVGDNGYLAYDFNNTGITGVIEMVGVVDFDPTQIQQLVT